MGLYTPPHVLLRTENAWGGLAPDLFVQSDGDSITAFAGEDNYLRQLRGLLRANRNLVANVSVNGVNGISYNYDFGGGTMIGNAATLVDPYFTPGFSQNWLVVFAGTNGMFGVLGNHSAATEYADFKTYVNARLAATPSLTATHVVAVTCLPRNADDDARVAAFNAALVGDADAIGYRVARSDLIPEIGQSGDETNATYYSDQVHLTAAGHTLIAQCIYDTMFP